MTPRVGDLLVSNFKNLSTASCNWTCVSRNLPKDVYIIQNQITGQIEQYTAVQLDIYYHFANRPNRRP